MLIDLLVILGLILLNGFFAMSEMAVVTSRPARLQAMLGNRKGARAALALASHPDNFLSAVQIGITLVGVLTGALGGIAIADDVASWLRGIPLVAGQAQALAVALSVGAITFATLILGELVPKRLALLNPEGIACLAAPVMTFVARVTRPAVLLLSLATRLVLRLLGVAGSAPRTVTDEEIRLLVAEAADQGVIERRERSMVDRVLRLGDRSLDSLMTPRSRIVWLDVQADPAQTLATIRDSRHTRFPVRRGDDQQVLGVFDLRSLVDRPDGWPADLAGRTRPVRYLPEKTDALRALAVLREDDLGFALVVDEYGDIQGLVTCDDILSALVGAAPGRPDPLAPPVPQVVRRHDGSWLVDGRLPVDDLRDLLDVASLPGEEDHEFHSIAGMLVARAGRIPEVGEAFQWRRWRFEVVDMDGARIDHVLIAPGDEPSGNGAGGDG